MHWTSPKTALEEKIPIPQKINRELPGSLRLGFWAFTAVAQVQSLVKELRSHKPAAQPKKELCLQYTVTY